MRKGELECLGLRAWKSVVIKIKSFEHLNILRKYKRNRKYPHGEFTRSGGERILGFSTSKIDQLIDQDETYDAGRYGLNIFERQMTHVKSLYGETGVEYYILHHLLDMEMIFPSDWKISFI